MGKIDDFYTHPEWKAIIDLADSTNFELVDHPDARTDAAPGTTAKTLRLFSKTTLRTYDVLQGELAETIFNDLQTRVLHNQAANYLLINRQNDYLLSESQLNNLSYRQVVEQSQELMGIPTKEQADRMPIRVVHPPSPVARADGKPGGLSHEDAKALRDSYIPIAEDRKKQLIAAGYLMPDGITFFEHSFDPKFDDIINANIDRCIWCDKSGVDDKHVIKYVWANGARYEELVRANVIDQDRVLLDHGFSPKTDLNSGAPVDLCQYCEMPSNDPTHGRIIMDGQVVGDDSPSGQRVHPGQCLSYKTARDNTKILCQLGSQHSGPHEGWWYGENIMWESVI